MKKQRLIIYASDISLITGKSHRQALRLLKDIHFVLGKQKHQPVTIREFAEYMGLEVEELMKALL
ncbi:hypothetical protein [Olivibacter sitiensis]|uniref:hypothetical protein n=1 Tax=Olivibacter sitiensis TaxID=376470 RepID=UPI000405FA3D|nr:hypothetical protein [Olivibacter sitiensis]